MATHRRIPGGARKVVPGPGAGVVHEVDTPGVRAENPEELVLGSCFDLSPDKARNIRRWVFNQDARMPNGRFVMFEPPRVGHTYVSGQDFGLAVGRDKDTSIGLDITEKPWRQVWEAEGYWGDDAAAILYGIHRLYHDPFMLGERQFGMHVLRELWKRYGYSFQWFERKEEEIGRPVTAKLGYAKSAPRATDPNMQALRATLRRQGLVIRSQPLIEQCENLQYAAKTSVDPDAATDLDLTIKLATGGSPDLVMALMYAHLAGHEIAHFERPKPKYAPGTLGDILGHDRLDKGSTDGKAPTWINTKA